MARNIMSMCNSRFCKSEPQQHVVHVPPRGAICAGASPLMYRNSTVLKYTKVSF
jgi:hypothetical protein